MAQIEETKNTVLAPAFPGAALAASAGYPRRGCVKASDS